MDEKSQLTPKQTANGIALLLRCGGAMGRRRKKSDGAALGLMIVVGGAIAAISWVVDEVEANLSLVIVVIGVGGFVALVALAAKKRSDRLSHDRRVRLMIASEQQDLERRATAYKERRDGLIWKFGNEQVVDAIMRGNIWHEMSKEQLLESWGQPEEIARKVLKTKIKETYKYDRTGVNRFARRAYLENDVVVGWED